MTLGDIKGHSEVKRMLTDITEGGRVSHSYIFSGKGRRQASYRKSVGGYANRRQRGGRDRNYK